MCERADIMKKNKTRKVELCAVHFDEANINPKRTMLLIHPTLVVPKFHSISRNDS